MFVNTFMAEEKWTILFSAASLVHMQLRDCVSVRLIQLNIQVNDLSWTKTTKNDKKWEQLIQSLGTWIDLWVIRLSYIGLIYQFSGPPPLSQTKYSTQNAISLYQLLMCSTHSAYMWVAFLMTATHNVWMFGNKHHGNSLSFAYRPTYLVPRVFLSKTSYAMSRAFQANGMLWLSYTI